MSVFTCHGKKKKRKEKKLIKGEVENYILSYLLLVNDPKGIGMSFQTTYH